MELKIIKEEKNPLFNRREISATLASDSSPKKQEVVQILSKKYSVPNNALRVLDIKGRFGTKEFVVRAHVYPSNEERDKYELLTKKEKEAEKKQVPETAEVSETKEIATEERTPAVVKVKTSTEEDKKEKDKSKEEKLNETELQA